MKKVCVVTGGTGGIGLATVKKLAEDYIVLFCDINQEKLDKVEADLRAEGLDVYGMLCDISDKAQTDALAARAAELGPVQGVVQLAGMTPTCGKHKLIARVDTIGPMNINESFYEVMGEGSCIIDICSSTAHFIPKDRWPYDLFKLALQDKEMFYEKFVEFIETTSSPENNMWANMAYTWARCFIYWYGQHCCYPFAREKGIRVNLVSPGIVATEDSMKSTAGGASDTMRFTMSWTPLGRTGRVEEIAFLFSTIIDERNTYLTGVEIPFDGGAVANGFCGQREEYVQA